MARDKNSPDPSASALADLRVCSSPYEMTDCGLVDAVIGEHARACLIEFLRKFRSQLGADSNGLTELLDRWTESGITFDAAWDPCFALVKSALFGSDPSPTRIAALVALRASADGVPGAWEVRAIEPLEFYLSEVIFPRTKQLRVERRHEKVRVSASSGHCSELDLLSSARTNGTSATLDRRLVTFPMEGHSARLAAGQPLRDALSYFQALDVTQADHGECCAVLAQAVATMRRHSVAYLSWVDKVVRELVILETRGDILRNASSENLPGAIAVSLPAAPLAIAEMLVHESAHQYAHIVGRVQDLCDPTDPRRYYSPVKGRERPIDMILLAFHAFANVVLFYRECIRSNIEEVGWCQAHIDRHLPELEVLATHLRMPNSLTEAGNLLWEPLAARVFDR